MTNFVAYIRVSTSKQGRSGLGLEAQKAMIDQFIASTPGARLLCPVYTEVESGKHDDRPVLTQAIERCKQTGAELLAAKLDRISRSSAFIGWLMKQIPFKVADRPQATPFENHLYAAFAEEESRKISERTKAAMAAAKARGKTFGGVMGDYRPPSDSDHGKRLGDAAGKVHARKANKFASELQHLIDNLRNDGVTSNKGLAAALNTLGTASPRGGQWTATAVRRLLERLGAMA
jgi:DNA invertase Pin-like site-specific DNA recombinase